MMRKIILVAGSLLVGTTQAYALCQDGPPFQCMIGGKTGERQCVGGHLTPCIPLEGGGGAGPVHGTLLPKYFVLTVVYAPPGTQGGRSSSSVSYGSGSTTGTTTSASSSFKQSYSITATAGGGVLGSVQVGLGFSYGRNSTDTSSLDVKKSTSTTIQDSGPSSDGIDHDHDLIYLWLNPKIDVALTSRSAAWSFTGTDTADIQYVYVGWLKDPAKMPPGVAQALQRHGISAQDFGDILTRDRFANGGAALDSARFQSLHTTFPYEPPYSPGDPVPTYSFNLSSSSTTTNGTSVQDDYKVSLTIQAGVDFLGLAKSSLKNEDSWDWTNTKSKSASSGSSESAAVTVGGPAFGYTGPTDMEVFYDTVYKTFLFRPVAGLPLGLKGRLLSSNGQPLKMKEVTVVANGVRYRTFTNAAGDYRVYGRISGPVKLQTNGTVHTLPQLRENRVFDLKLR